MIHPSDYYTLFRRRQEELQRQAAYERMLRAARDERALRFQVHRQLVTWLAMCLMIAGQKLERYGAFGGVRRAPHASRHH